VYYGIYNGGLNNKAYPVIRMGGIYLAKLNFEIGDTIEVIFEPGRITIMKVDIVNASNVKM
jgi:hypothetical protein